MNILESIMGGSGDDSAAVRQIAAQFGISPQQAAAAMGALMPAVTAGLKRNVDTNEAGLEAALTGGSHETYVDQPDALALPATAADGNAILGHIFGSKDVSREVAANAAQKTGIDPAILKKMLPIIAAIAMGALAKRTKSAGGAGDGAGDGAGATRSGGGLGSILGPLLDRNKDGSIADDVTGMLGGMLGRKM